MTTTPSSRYLFAQIRAINRYAVALAIRTGRPVSMEAASVEWCRTMAAKYRARCA